MVGSELADPSVESSLPRARTTGLVVRELADEVLVYDLKRNRAYCLNPTAALVWKRCNGRTTVDEVARLLGKEFGTPVDERIVWYALSQLERDHLLSDTISGSPAVTRRQMVQLLGAATLAVPVISSVIAPSAAAAASCLPKHTSGCKSCLQCCSSSPSIPPCSAVYGSGCCKTVKGSKGATSTECGTINAQGACA